MIFSVDEFKELNLSPNEYVVLYALLIEDYELQSYINSLIGPTQYVGTLLGLQENLFIKINEDRSYVLRKKALDLKEKEEPKFSVFWDKYHEVTNQKKTDMQPALKYWKKLTIKEKELAIDNIENYFNSLPIYKGHKPVKKARTYLGDKNFNDEFIIYEEHSINKMV